MSDTPIKNKEVSTDKMLETASSFHMSVLKWPVLINGGAAVSLLGFMGTQGGQNIGAIPVAMLVFTFGVFFGAASYSVAYTGTLISFTLHILDLENAPPNKWKLVGLLTSSAITIWTQVIATIMHIISYSLFVIGSCVTAYLLS